jgi:hypothetical protein
VRRLDLAAVMVTLALMGCSGPHGAVEVPPERLPFPLARTPTPSPTPPAERLVDIFLVREGRLVGVRRLIAGDMSSTEASMRALLLGPSATERASGVETAVPAATQLVGLSQSGDIVSVDLSTEFQSPAEPRDVLIRVAQVVWTLAEIDDVAGVRFSVDGVPIDVPIDDGTTPDRPVGPSDYASVSPPGDEIVTDS